MSKDKESPHLPDSIDSLIIDEKISQSALFDTEQQAPNFHQELTDKLIHLSRFGNLLTLVLGDQGTGKTYLLEQFIEALDDDILVSHIIAQPLMSTELLLQQMLADYGLDEMPVNHMTALEEWLASSAESAHRLLVIDNADSLSTEVMTEICKLSASQQSKETPTLQVFLFAHHDLNLTLETSAQGIFDEGGIYTIDVPALRRKAAGEFLSLLLQQRQCEVSASDIDAMLNEARGNPGKLIVQADIYATEQPMEYYEDDDYESESGISGMGFWFAGLTLVVLLVLSAVFYQDELTVFFEPDQESSEILAMDPVSVSPTIEPEQVEDSQIDESQSQTVAMSERSDTELPKQVVVDQVEESEPLREVVTQEPSIGTLDNQEEVNDVLPKAGDETETSKAGSIENTNATDIKEIAETPPRKIGSQTASQKLQDGDGPTIETPQTQDSLSTQEASVSESYGYTDTEQSLLNGDPDSYVIQIIGLSKQSSVDGLIRKFPNLNMQSYRSLLKDKLWYIVVIPGYTTAQEAGAAKQQLPSELMKNGPWIKQLNKVQAQIRQAAETQSP